MRIRRRKLRVGVIGTGAFARACHLPEIASHPHAEVVMLCGRDAARTKALAMEFGVAATTLDATELYASDEVDAVTICTPNNLHARHALLAIQHGKHVFCEKPLGFTVDEAQAMVDAANQRKLVHQVGFTFRHLFGVEEMRRRVRGGDIGEPQVLRIHHQYFDGLAEGDPVRWQHTLEVAGGGVLRDSGSHLFDLARLMLGPVAALRAEIRSSERPGVDTDDVATARLRYVSGAQGNCFASRIMPARQPNFVEVVGSKGTLQALISRGGFDALRRSTGGESIDVTLPAEAADGKFHALRRMMHAFRRRLPAGEAEPRRRVVRGRAGRPAHDRLCRGGRPDSRLGHAVTEPGSASGRMSLQLRVRYGEPPDDRDLTCRAPSLANAIAEYTVAHLPHSQRFALLSIQAGLFMRSAIYKRC